MDRGSSVHGISQARILEQVTVSFSRGIFPTQGSNLHVLHFQVDSLLLSHLGSMDMQKCTDMFAVKRCHLYSEKYKAGEGGQMWRSGKPGVHAASQGLSRTGIWLAQIILPVTLVGLLLAFIKR